jgi:hypothetical protein
MKVTTQKQLDDALAKSGYAEIIIDSPRGVWLKINGNDGKYVRASGSASVRASGSASVRAYGSASVRAYDSASVEAYDSASVEAYDSASVRAYDSASVRAYDSASVEASKYVAIHLNSKRVTVDGGVVIDVSDIDTNRVTDFIDYHGVDVSDGFATVYKTVDDALFSGRGFAYPIGETVTAPDWRASNACGEGLHFGYTPRVAKGYFGDATRFLECRVAVGNMVALGDKVKAESAFVVREVTLDGDPV